MKGDGNKYLNTLKRIFGPAVEKAMPVMLKVAFGSIGVLFVTALVLMYSDKRSGMDGDTLRLWPLCSRGQRWF